ncbi:PAS domain-containing sensor histidine kinase [Magnetovibrio blakemorei]|uniref:histidine kinase n=1 Tax=Magnetovibrio blakemorei TaxID=28181 RepID=A0A1E5QAN9_9PROT|nr:PAS domain S-box protein [Magnetovibrio blakemorei]OEJ69040.1 hypothetical protein BEN30_04835 [Magnetovibrio blakemorei]
MIQVPNHKINYRRWLGKAVLVLTCVSLSSALLSNWLLYNAAYQEETVRLTELAQTQAILINTVAQFNALHPSGELADDAQAATFFLLKAAHNNYPGFGETGEFTLGTRKGDNIVFVLSHRHFDFAEMIPIPWESKLGEPMRRALNGISGTILGYDYRGEMVLAAHEPLPMLKAGIVAKIDLQEIRKPFIRAALISLIGVALMTIIGTLVFLRISKPLAERDAAMVELRILTHVFEQSPNMMFITDTKGTIEYINPCFTKMTGYTPEEAIGQTPRLLKSGDTPPDFYASMWENLTAGREWRGEIKDRRKDGEVFWASMVAAPVMDENGEIKHFVTIHEDITEHKLEKLRTQEAYEQAEIANRAKSEIMANMSHELRTPLNAIIGFSSAMQGQLLGPLGNEKYLEYAGDIKWSGTHLLDIINDILDASAIEAGKLVLHEENVDVADAMNSMLRLVAPKADLGGVALTEITQKDLPNVFADSRRLKQIFLNLLSNAVKFTPEHGEVSCDAFVDANGAMVISVTDTGIGMDAKGLAKAMEQFGQVDSSLARKHDGTGLGLSLTKGLVEMHQGIFTIKSALGKGTKATVTLPAKRVLSKT